ncbi:MAG: hypothetical protein M1820_005741 [Bogoriella megaspora]|nr:MAG: hypothetical protein M1820_005741 [Bogoriella megaspora]
MPRNTGWTEAEDIALLLRFMPKPVQWANFEPLEGRTVKACKERIGQLQKKAGIFLEERPPGMVPEVKALPRKRKPSKKVDDGQDDDEPRASVAKESPKKRKRTKKEDDDDVIKVDESSPSPVMDSSKVKKMKAEDDDLDLPSKDAKVEEDITDDEWEA